MTLSNFQGHLPVVNTIVNNCEYNYSYNAVIITVVDARSVGDN